MLPLELVDWALEWFSPFRLIGGGMILIPAIGYHFKKVVHSDVGQGEL